MHFSKKFFTILVLASAGWTSLQVASWLPKFLSGDSKQPKDQCSNGFQVYSATFQTKIAVIKAAMGDRFPKVPWKFFMKTCHHLIETKKTTWKNFQADHATDADWVVLFPPDGYITDEIFEAFLTQHATCNFTPTEEEEFAMYAKNES